MKQLRKSILKQSLRKNSEQKQEQAIKHSADPIQKIKTIVCNHFGIEREKIDLKTNKDEIVIPRQIAHTMAKAYTKHTLEKIGKKIGDRNHATVLNSIKKTNNRYDTEPKFKIIIEDIRAKIEKEVL